MNSFGENMIAPTPMLPPWWWSRPEQPQRQETPRDAVPPRVQLAMQYVQMMTAKTAQNPVKWGPLVVEGSGATDTGGVMVVPGAKLEQEEGSALATACNLLSQYFAGQMPLTRTEKAEQDRLAKLEKFREADAAFEGEVCQIGCPECVAKGPMGSRAKCKTCRGQGYVYIPFSRTEAT